MIKKIFIHYLLIAFFVCALKAADSQGAISYLRAVINSPESKADDVAHARLQLAMYWTQKSDYWESLPAETVVSCYSDIIMDSGIPADIRLVCKYRYLMICSRSIAPLLCDKKLLLHYAKNYLQNRLKLQCVHRSQLLMQMCFWMDILVHLF